MIYTRALFLAMMLAPQAAAQMPLLKDAPVPGWPKLRIETYYVGRLAMRGNCFPVPAGTPIPETSRNSCARPDFWRGVCDIFIDVRHVADGELRQREEKRCRGYDYRDSSRLAEAWRAWREHGENRYANRLDFRVMRLVAEPAAACTEEDESCIEVR